MCGVCVAECLHTVNINDDDKIYGANIQLDHT